MVDKLKKQQYLDHTLVKLLPQNKKYPSYWPYLDAFGFQLTGKTNSNFEPIEINSYYIYITNIDSQEPKARWCIFSAAFLLIFTWFSVISYTFKFGTVNKTSFKIFTVFLIWGHVPELCKVDVGHLKKLKCLKPAQLEIISSFFDRSCIFQNSF